MEQKQYEIKLKEGIANLLKELDEKESLKDNDKEKLLIEFEELLNKYDEHTKEESNIRLKFRKIELEYAKETKKINMLSKITLISTCISVAFSFSSSFPSLNIKFSEGLIVVLFALAAIPAIIGIFMRSFLNENFRQGLKDITTSMAEKLNINKFTIK